MISEDLVADIFRQYIPEQVHLVFVNRDKFITDSLGNDFIREQIRVGIYSEDNIWDDFLCAAKAYSLLCRVEVCIELIEQLTEGLDDELTGAFIHWTAAHEAHHFEDSHMIPSADPRAQARHEQDCNALVSARYPELEARMTQVEENSSVYKRVYARIENIQAARM